MRQSKRMALVLVAAAALLAASMFALGAAGAAGPTVVSRAQFVEALAQAIHLQPVHPSQPTFVDVGPSNPYYGYIEAAVQAGWISGLNPTHFDPSGPLTRAQIAKIEVVAVGQQAAALAQMQTATSFRDDAGIPAWARGYIVEAVSLGLIRGYPGGAFEPDALITTAQLPAFLRQYETVAAAAPAVHWQTIGPDGFLNDLTANAATTATTGLAAAGKVGAVAVDYADPEVMYAGAAGGDNRGPLSEAGVYATTDGGTTWQMADTGLTDTQVNDLWLDQSNPQILLAATAGGIFRSTDGAASWSPVTTTAAIGFARIGDVLYAGTDTGVFSSTDLGKTWTLVEPTQVPVSAISAAGQDLFVAAQSSLLERTASGWHVIYQAPQDAGDWISWVIANPSNPSDIYFRHCPIPAGQGLCVSELAASTDGGATWRQPSLPTTYQIAQFIVHALALDPTQPGTLYVGGNSVFSVSTDGGQTFQQIPLNVDIWYLKPWPGRSGTLLAGTDQGLYLVTDGGKDWQSLNGDLTTSLLYNVAVQGSTIFASAQDYSPFYSFDGGKTWASQNSPGAAAGEGGEDFIDPSDPSVVLVMGGCCGLQVSTDGGHTFSQVATVGSAQYNQDPQAIAVGSSGQIYVAAADGVFESTDGGQSFAATGWPIAHPSFVAVSPSGEIFVGNETSQPDGHAGYADAGVLEYSRDNGATWQQANLGSATGYPVTLAFDPANPEDMLLGMSSGPQDGGGILKSSDGGQSFARDNGGIAAIARYWAQTPYPAVWQISFAPGGGLAVAATSNGLYALRSGSSNWTSIRANAAPFMFTGIAWASGNLYVSTMGEGVVEAPISSLPSP